MPYQSLGERVGALALMSVCSRFAIARSGPAISAIFATTATSASASLAAAFSSLARCFIADFSSAVNPLDVLPAAVPLLADFCVAFVGLMGTSLFRVWLIAALRAVTDPPDVAVEICERTTVPAPLQLRRGLEDLGAGLLGFVHHRVNSRLAANDVVHDHAGKAAALRIHANVRR